MRREDGAVENWESLYLEVEILRCGACTFHEAHTTGKIARGGLEARGPFSSTYIEPSSALELRRDASHL